MNSRTPGIGLLARGERGLTLIELTVAIGIFAGVMLTITLILFRSNGVQSRTVKRAEVQASTRQALSIMTTEIRQAGADPSIPAAGIVGIVSADARSIHVRSDLNGNGTIQMVEPSEDVTYRYDPATQTVFRDPGTGAAPLVTHVTGMTLTYFDLANQPLTALPLNVTDAARVHSIGVSVTTEDRDSKPLTLTTTITLRNL